MRDLVTHQEVLEGRVRTPIVAVDVGNDSRDGMAPSVGAGPVVQLVTFVVWVEVQRRIHAAVQQLVPSHVQVDALRTAEDVERVYKHINVMINTIKSTLAARRDRYRVYQFSVRFSLWRSKAR